MVICKSHREMFNNSLIVDKFYQFILPNTAKVFAVCISAFVDALIVATLLGSEAMAIVNLGNPIILTVSTIGALLTVGGSTLYASACGAFDKPKADRIFSVATYTALAISILLTLIAYLSRGTIVTWLCAGNLQLIDSSSSYIGILIGSMPVLTAANVLFGFLPSAGKPKMSSMLMLLANVVNLCLDIFFIKVCGMGIEGAAYATVCGYGAALLWYLICYWRKKVNTLLVRITSHDLLSLKEICSMGASSSLSQLSFVLKITLCNSIALHYGGDTGLIAFSVCMQLLSITSIFVGGIGSSMINITATLRGGRDFLSSQKVVSRAYSLIFICALVTLAVFCAFSHQIATIYKATEGEVHSMTVQAIRIFSLAIILRSIIVVFMFYVQSIHKTAYASFISLFDGFVGNLPIAACCCMLMGINGLWWSFPITSVILTLIILAWNLRLLKKDRSMSFRNILLIERDADILHEESVTEELTDASGSLILAHEAIKTHGWNDILSSYLTTLAARKSPVKIDWLIRQFPDRFILDIRSNVNSITEKQIPTPDNIKVTNEMVLGMNCLRMVSKS
ncbi:MAG: hypothetical protein KBT39_05665 [Bacteroidales bacterium]|nr:hypothetical protein [Bacteroidales bacterium]